MISKIIDVLSDSVLWIADHVTPAFSSAFAGWFFIMIITLLITLAALLAVAFLPRALATAVGTPGERSQGKRPAIALTQVVAGFVAFCLGVASFVEASQKRLAENEQISQEHTEEAEQSAEEMIDDIDGVVDFEVSASDPEDDGLGTVIISAETASSRDVTHAVLTHADADEFEVIWVRLVDDVDIYGVDNATLVEAFSFSPGEIDADQLDVETVLHHGHRADYDPASPRG